MALFFGLPLVITHQRASFIDLYWGKNLNYQIPRTGCLMGTLTNTVYRDPR